MWARSGSRTNPPYASSLIGRDAEIARLKQLIEEPDIRFVTITGTAGVGKTRLATVIANSVDLPDVTFVSLMTIRDWNLVLPEIGRALGLQGEDVSNSLGERLASFNGLLILDNFEQVIDAAFPVATVIPSNPELTVIITSQRPLQLAGERVIRLAPLSIPEPNIAEKDILTSPSVRLLVQRATEQDSSFKDTLLEPSASHSVAEICRRLDGIPLALELAASRLTSLTPEVVLKQLEQDQSILSSQRGDIPERQRTMQSAIDWSFQLLPDESQRVFLWLGCFTAGFDIEIVERVLLHLEVDTPAVDVLGELINLSLVHRVSRGADPWYSMLDSMRQFCLGILNERSERHAAESLVSDYIINLADQSKDQLSGPNINEWMARLARNMATIRSSVGWGIANEDPRVAISVGARMPYFFEHEGTWREAVGWIDAAMEWSEKLPTEAMINALISKLSMQEAAQELENADETDESIRNLLATVDVPLFELRYLTISGNVAIDRQDWDVAIDKYQRTLEIAERENFPQATSAALANLGNVAHHRGRYPEAEAYMLRALAIFEDMGNHYSVTQALSNLSSINTGQGKYQESLSYLYRAAEITDDLGLQPQGIYIQLGLASTYHGLMDLEEADEASQEAIMQARDLGFDQLAAMGYLRLGTSGLIKKDVSEIYTNVLLALELQERAQGDREYVQTGFLVAGGLELEGKYKQAALTLGKTLALAGEIEYSPDVYDRKTQEGLVERIAELTPNYEAHLEHGKMWTRDQFIRNLTWAARGYANKPATLLITVPAVDGERGRMPDLTPRENEILELLIAGESTQSMARRLSLSPRTITTHIGNMMAKNDVNSRTELVAKVLRNHDRPAD